MINRRHLVGITSGVIGLMALAGRKSVRAASPPPGQQTYFLLALTNPIAGQEEAYARWFSEPHLRDVGALPGFVAAQRYTDAKVELRGAARKTPQDLILYTIVTDHPDEARDVIARQAATGGAWPGSTLASVQTTTYRAIQPRMDGVGGEPANAQAGEVATYLVIAFLNAVAGQDAAFNTWYDTVHEPELMAYPGVVSGQRAVLSEVQMGPSDIQAQYLMQLTLATSDLPAVFREMLAGGGPPPSMDRARNYGFTYRAVGP